MLLSLFCGICADARQCDPCANAKRCCRRVPGKGPDFDCERCYDTDRVCVRKSQRYKWVYTGKKLAALRMAASGFPHLPSSPPPPAPRTRAPSATHAEAGPSRLPRARSPTARVPPCAPPGFNTPWDPRIDVARLDLANATSFWRNELLRAEGLAAVTNSHLAFTRQMCLEALERSMVPSAKESHAENVQPSGASPLDKGKGRA